MSGQRVLLAIAALWGLLGVVLWAAGSHPPMVSAMATGGQMMLVHAVAVLALLNSTLVAGWRRAAPLALWLTGSGLFALETVLRHLIGVSPLGLLAPIGGGVVIIGWLVLAAGAVTAPRT